MAADFGLLVTRYNSSTPSYSSNNDLRELRIDAGGRVHSRMTDGNDNTVSFFADGDAVGSGVGNQAVAGDRGVLVLGKDYTDAIYKPLKILNDGSLVISTNGGTDASAAADKANAGTTGGEVGLTVGSYVLIQSIPFTANKFHVFGYSYASDKNTMFQLAIAVHVGAGSPIRSELTEILDTQISSSARPSHYVGFNRQLDKAGAANTYLCVFAKQLQQGAAGIGATMINVDTST